MVISKDLKHQKQELLHYFRARANEILSELAISHAPDDCKGKAKAINKELIKSKLSDMKCQDSYVFSAIRNIELQLELLQKLQEKKHFNLKCFFLF